MEAIEPLTRQYCVRALDPLSGSDRFDFISDIGSQIPMRTIGYLLGIPEQNQAMIRNTSNSALTLEEGEFSGARADLFEDSQALFAEYIDWRADHPSDDLMTELLQADFEDETGTVRRLTREEILLYVTVIAGAGNETTTRLIGWAGKVLAEHPDQRGELVADRSLIPNAIEELLRFESPAPYVGRCLARDVELHGQTVAAGNIMLFLFGSANHDERKYPEPDQFDIHRELVQHLTFGFGIHFCLGAALARLEGRIALDEVLDRFPEWEVDWDRAKMAQTSTVRGWETLPVFTS
jgi:cytochrome P450